MTHIFFIFVVFWSPTWIISDHTFFDFASSSTKWKNNVNPNINRFNIHGVWPNFYNDTYPEYCNGQSYNNDTLSTIFPLLDVWWTNYQNTTQFLEHEWNKHGICAMDFDERVTDEYDFFVRGLRLFYSLNPTFAFYISGVIPNKTYTLVDIENRMRLIYGYEPVVTCELFITDSLSVILLDEIRMCYNKDFEIIGCPDFCYNEKCQYNNVFVPELY